MIANRTIHIHTENKNNVSNKSSKSNNSNSNNNQYTKKYNLKIPQVQKVHVAVTKYRNNIQNYKIPIKHYDSIARFGSLYAVSLSIVLVWRGTWMLWDIGYEHFHQGKFKAIDKDHQTKSGLASHLVACGCLLIMGRFSSVLAPPASRAILNDKTFRFCSNTWREYATKLFR